MSELKFETNLLVVCMHCVSQSISLLGLNMSNIQMILEMSVRKKYNALWVIIEIFA